MERKIKMLSKQQNFGGSSGIVTAYYEKTNILGNSFSLNQLQQEVYTMDKRWGKLSAKKPSLANEKYYHLNLLPTHSN